MIFKQCLEIATGAKTQTRRVAKPHESWRNDNCNAVVAGGRLKWEVGRTYAVVPKRSEPALWWQRDRCGDVHFAQLGMEFFEHKNDLKSAGYRPLRIRLTDIRQEHLHEISAADAIAEGIDFVGDEHFVGMRNGLFYTKRQDTPIEAYRGLWQSINKRTGTRWEDNPEVWVLEFELCK